MTITSLDALPASGPISFSEMRTFYGATGAVSLNATFNGGQSAVPDTLPASGATTSVSDYFSAARILRKQGATETFASGTSWTPRTGSTGAVEYHVWAIGGGGSGGCGQSDSGREKVGSGGGAGGTAFRRYSVSTHSVTSASVAIGTGGTGVAITSTSSGQENSGYNGGTTTFTPNGTGTAIFATGGTRGFGNRQGNSTIIADYEPPTTPVGENSRSAPTGTWGACSAGEGGTGSGGESNYTGGKGPACSRGSNGAQATGGGSPNLGSGSHDGNTLSVGTSGATTGAYTTAPTKPTEWGSDVTATFQGGYPTASAVYGSPPATSGSATNYGAGSGGSAAEVDVVSTGNGAPGVVIINYYEVNT